MVRFVVAGLLLLLPEAVFSQRDSLRHFRHEAMLTIDNDIFLFDDYYYTAGQDIVYRRLVKPERKLHKRFNKPDQTPSKILVTYRYGNKIYTPKEIKYRTPRNMDRPYAGWNYGNFSITRLKGKSTVSQLETEIGLVGEISGMGQVQQWWHTETGFPTPKGWEYQIENEVVVNFNFQLYKCLRLAKGVDIVSQSGAYAGTGLNKLSQDLTLRLFDAGTITESIFTNSRLGLDDQSGEEAFIFIGYGVDCVITNIFLEGSLFSGNPSPFTVEAEPWLIRNEVGIMYAKDRGSFVLSVNSTSKEMAGGFKHSYLRFAFARRF